MSKPVPRTPRWAVVTAWATVASVIPSAVWRVAVGLGVPLGWSQRQLDAQAIPGWGTAYVIALSLLSLAAATLTLGLVQPWGERLPARLTILGDRSVPRAVVVGFAIAGAVAVLAICVLSILNWDAVSGFRDRPRSGWALLMIACYLPALLWSPLLLATTWAYWRRRSPPDARRLTTGASSP